jgi:hypothetical protein
MIAAMKRRQTWVFLALMVAIAFPINAVHEIPPGGWMDCPPKHHILK